MCDDAVEVSVSYRGAAHAVTLPRRATLSALASALARVTGAAPDTLRLLHAGRALPLRGEATLAEAELPAPSRCLLLGATAAELTAVRDGPADAAARDAAARIAPPEHAAAVARRRRAASLPAVTLPTGAHVFASFRVLEAAAGAHALTPSPAAALHLLHRLAADPGIAAVMAQRRWRVGLLSECPPEGKVGVSESCVLGFNVNKGQEISLRLRTDDWRGFRGYERIRETLIHELAHMVHSEHGFPFKELNSDLTRQAAAADWTRRGGRTLGGGAWGRAEEFAEYEEEDLGVMARTAASSGKALGGHGPFGAMPPPRSAHEAAAAAAQLRASAAQAEAAEAAMAAEARAALQAAERMEAEEAAAPALAEPMEAEQAVASQLPSDAPAAPAADLAPPEAVVAAAAAEPPAAPAAPAAAGDDVTWRAEEAEDPELSRVAASAAAAGAKAAAAAAALSRAAGASGTAEGALRTVAAVLRNALSAPSEPRFRSLPLAPDSAFVMRAGRYPDALALLRAAGFAEAAEAGQPRLKLTRDDPALLWLALSAVNDQLEACGVK